MIDAEAIARAERILQITYQEKAVPRQLQSAQVDLDAFNALLLARTERCQQGLPIQWRKVDARIHQMYNTLLMHFFLVGLVAGRDETREVI